MLACSVGWACLLESRELMKPFHRLGQLFLSIPSVQPTRLGAFGVSLRCVSQKHNKNPAADRAGDGHSKVTCGRSSALQIYPLQRAADS